MHRLMQAVDYEPENVLDCPHCGGLYDLRFWEVEDDEACCPECAQTTSVDDLVASIEERQ